MEVLIKPFFAVVLLIIMDFLGKRSIDKGYQYNIFNKNEGGLMFNYLFRVLGPNIYLFILVSIIQKLNINFLTNNIVIDCYFIVIYYYILKIFIKIIFGRLLFISFNDILAYILGSLLAIFVYHGIIIKVDVIIPDFSNLINELWIAILIYLYNIINKLSFFNYRYNNNNEYILGKYSKFIKKYDKIFNEKKCSSSFKKLLYSIMIVEDYNRPCIVRFIENIINSKTKGIMQVNHKGKLTDKESIKLAIDLVENIDKKITLNNTNNTEFEFRIFDIALEYNPDYQYAESVTYTYNVLRFADVDN